jgi:hypothetical protein
VATDIHVFSSQNLTDGQWEKYVIGQSGWSNTQTITIPASSASGSPSPTPTVPEFSWLVILPLCVALLFVAVKLKHRMTTNLNK